LGSDVNCRQIQYFIQNYYKGKKIKGAVKNMNLFNAVHLAESFNIWQDNRLSVSEQNRLNRLRRTNYHRKYRAKLEDVKKKNPDGKRIARFEKGDVLFFKSWNKRRPEKYRVNLKDFSIMGFKLKKNARGRYVTVNSLTDLSDIWYSSRECKALCEKTGECVGVVHFLNVVGWK